MTDLLTRYRERAERALDARLPPATAAPARLHEAMRYATLGGGKRVRACLVYAAGAALGARAEALDAPACAVELIHAYSLVHDDLPCMDDDDLRRGKPTCHKTYDEATALLVGDSLQTLAFELLARDASLAVNPARRLEMIALLARAAGSQGMAGGQAIDLASVGKKLALDELQDMHARKTGALIRAAVRLGALAAESANRPSLACGPRLDPIAEPADENLIAALDHYADAVGLAFQIADDVLDVEGETGVLGKRAGADEARGKPTYAALLGLEGAKTKAKALLDRALESLAPLGDNGALLAQLARYIVERRQ